MIGSLARRYAKALFALARERQALEPVSAEIQQIATVAAEPSIHDVLNNPMLPPSRRLQVVDLILKEIGPSDLTARFVRVLADHQRIGQLSGIAREYNRLLDQHLGRVKVIVRSPTPLSEDQRKQIVAAFGPITGKSVLATFETDPALLGGVVVEAEGKVYDGSIKTQLERLAKQLSGEAQ